MVELFFREFEDTMLKFNIYLIGLAICLFLKTKQVLMIAANGDLNFLLVGKTGSGKSATGNTILGQKVFDTSSGLNSRTKDVTGFRSFHDGRVLTVVDSPGVIDTELSPTEYLHVYFEHMSKAMQVRTDGYHAFLVVVRYGVRFTNEDELTFYALSRCFGEEYFTRYGVLVVTFADMYDPDDNNGQFFLDWIHTKGGVLKEMKDKFGGRVVLFDNKSKDETKRKAQVDRLIRIVDQLSVLNSQYTRDHFRLARFQRDKCLVESKLPGMESEVKKEIDLVIHKLNDIKSHHPTTQLSLLPDLKTILANLLIKIKERDMNTGVLNAVMAGIRDTDEHIQLEIDSLKRHLQGNELQQHRSGGLISSAIESAKSVLSWLFNLVKRYVFWMEPDEWDRPRLN